MVKRNSYAHNYVLRKTCLIITAEWFSKKNAIHY